MKSSIKTMFEKYDATTPDDYRNAMKEIIQHLVLLGLWRGKFFDRAAFYGGTCLRILYGLNRFSEDMDFSLLKPDPNFSLEPYLKAVRDELISIGFNPIIEVKIKNNQSAIKSAFLKADTREHMIQIGLEPEDCRKFHLEEKLKIKLEVDIDPPGKFATEAYNLLEPIPFFVNTYTKPDLFAGKLHALLFRDWKNRVKGRDWYDLIWYIGQKIPVHLEHLEARMNQSNHLNKSLTESNLRALLDEKIESLNVDLAKQDVKSFLNDPNSIDVWSKDFFHDIVKRIVVI